MLGPYVPILLLLAVVLGFAIVSIVLSELLGRRRLNVGKGEAYECGMEPQGSARVRLSIHFYLVAVLFIVFDVEAVFLFLWAAGSDYLEDRGLGLFVFAQVSLFVFVLGLTLAYEWRKGGLEWDR